MTWNEIKHSVNQWIWDNDERVYFWVVKTFDDTKSLRIRGFSGLENEIFYTSKRFSKDAKKAREEVSQ